MSITGPSTTSASSHGNAQRGPAHGIPIWEWIAAATGLLLLIGAVWVLLASRPSGVSRPPAVLARPEPAVEVPGGWLVRFQAENPGDETVADVRLRATLVQGDRLVEMVEARLDYLPARSVRRGGIFFSHDPRAGVVEIRAAGYQEP